MDDARDEIPREDKLNIRPIVVVWDLGWVLGIDGTDELLSVGDLAIAPLPLGSTVVFLLSKGDGSGHFQQPDLLVLLVLCEEVELALIGEGDLEVEVPFLCAGY